MKLDAQTMREIQAYEAMIKDQNTLYNSKYGKVRINREEGTLDLGVTEGSILSVHTFNPDLPIWLNIMIAEEEFENLMSSEDVEDYAWYEALEADEYCYLEEDDDDWEEDNSEPVLVINININLKK